jgi:hypothetical protein
MSDTMIFTVGLVTFLLFAGGIAFTLSEVQRLGAQATASASQPRVLESKTRRKIS